MNAGGAAGAVVVPGAGDGVAGTGGVCGRPMWATIHVPTQWLPCCARAGCNSRSAVSPVRTSRLIDLCVACAITILLLVKDSILLPTKHAGRQRNAGSEHQRQHRDV